MAPSQLAQLKNALSSAGLSRQSHGKKQKKTARKAGQTEKDREKKQAKLDSIRQQLNKFDVRENKVKHEILHANKKTAKGTVGTPSRSRQAAIEARREALLPELELRRAGHTGTFIDRRFGEDNPSMTPEEKALARFTRTREAENRRSRKEMYNLNDEDEGLGLGFGDEDGNHLGGMRLTHGGRSIDELQGDDFTAQGLLDDEDDDDDIADDFGMRADGLESDAADVPWRNKAVGIQADDDPDRQKTKAEVMAEVIAKSKSYKLARQQQKEMDAEMREELDEGLDELRELLGGAPSQSSRATLLGDVDSAEGTKEPGPTSSKPKEDTEYDQVVRALAYEARAKPKDRTKTEEELVAEEAEKLKEAEAARLRRMRGEESPEPSDGETAERSSRHRKGKEREHAPARAPEGDDLGDDFDFGQPSASRLEYGIGEGIKAQKKESDRNPSSVASDSESEIDDEEDGDEDEELEDDEAEADGNSDLDSDEEDEDVDAQMPARVKRAQPIAPKEIPYTFDCPEVHDDFLDIVSGLSESDTEIVVKRIRTLYHPSLGEGNKDKLATFLGVLLDHVVYIGASSPVTINNLYPHICALVKLNVLPAAEHFKAKIDVMAKNLARGLAKGAGHSGSRTFPGFSELVVLRLIGALWSTSDFSHPVAAPAILLMGQYLAQSRIRDLKDVASGLYLCALILQYEAFSKRIAPEMLNFLASTIAILSPRPISTLPGTFPLSELNSSEGVARLAPLRLTKDAVSPQSVHLTDILSDDIAPTDQSVKGQLMACALDLCRQASTLYSENEAFVEVFTPLADLLGALSGLPKSLQTSVSDNLSALCNRIRLSKQSRGPLQLQTHKPIPIPQYTPKFDADFSRDRKRDPDTERNEAKKVKALYKKERKGAIRELRKDNKFLAVEKAKAQKAKDEAYEKRMRQVHGEITTTERAEEKQMEREKNREKRRAGRD